MYSELLATPIQIARHGCDPITTTYGNLTGIISIPSRIVSEVDGWETLSIDDKAAILSDITARLPRTLADNPPPNNMPALGDVPTPVGVFLASSDDTTPRSPGRAGSIEDWEATLAETYERPGEEWLTIKHFPETDDGPRSTYAMTKKVFARSNPVWGCCDERSADLTGPCSCGSRQLAGDVIMAAAGEGGMGTVTIQAGDETWEYHLMPSYEELVARTERVAETSYQELCDRAGYACDLILGHIAMTTVEPVDLAANSEGTGEGYDLDDEHERAYALIEHVLADHIPPNPAVRPSPIWHRHPDTTDDTRPAWVWGSTEETRDWWTPTITVETVAQTEDGADVVAATVGYQHHTRHPESLQTPGWAEVGHFTLKHNINEQTYELVDLNHSDDKPIAPPTPSAGQGLSLAD